MHRHMHCTATGKQQAEQEHSKSSARWVKGELGDARGGVLVLLFNSILHTVKREKEKKVHYKS